jgi:hypothetical protein
MSLEFVFFDESSLGHFVGLLEQRGVPWKRHSDSMDGSVVSFPDALPDALLDEVVSRYDALMAQASAAAEFDPNLVENRVLGVDVTLADGRPRTVRLDGATGNLLLRHFTPQEAQRLVQAIARSLEAPVDGPLCARSAE